MLKPYSIAVKALLIIKHNIDIVVVGANDGMVNDPIYEFCMKNSDKSSICLIEPNSTLIPYLRENYSSHPSHKIANCAVGKDGILTLYAIKEEFWQDFQPDYAKGWPVYRAATGITSASREHIEQALASYPNINPEAAIVALDIPSKTLETILLELNWQIPIDVLQIDAEGHDDSVIYASNLRLTKPALIYFESRHIPADRIQSLSAYLSSHNYRTYEIGGDTLAVDGRTNLLCVYLNGIVMFLAWAWKLLRR